MVRCKETALAMVPAVMASEGTWVRREMPSQGEGFRGRIRGMVVEVFMLTEEEDSMEAMGMLREDGVTTALTDSLMSRDSKVCLEPEEMVDNPSLLDMYDDSEDLGIKEGRDDEQQEFMQDDSEQQNGGSGGRMEVQQGAQDQQGGKHNNANLKHVLDQANEVEAEVMQWEMQEAIMAMGLECDDEMEDELIGQGTDVFVADPQTSKV
jgi:hypothetical protein